MASKEELINVKYGVLIPAHSWKGRNAIFTTHTTLIGLFKYCGNHFNYIPHGNEIYVISRTITKDENDTAYQKWLKWYNKGGAKRRKAARKRVGR